MNRFKGFVAGALLAATALNASAAFTGDRADFRDETIYFAITTRFYDGDPKNNVLCWDGVENQKKNNDPCWRGDFAGLIKKLDYIKALGFTAIWITPIVQNASGFDYHGYHAMDFSRVDLRYESRTEWGSSEDVDFQDLIDAAHDRDMKVVLDIVLQHTGNFGEEYFCHLFDRDQNIKNQANIEACLIPDDEKLGGAAYWDLPNEGDRTQYSERFKYLKNTDGQNHDDKNYWHHVSTSWNWDLPNRWWGQIAGDCVDLNTENPAVVDYIVECYGKFIEMGVDGFRIDTTGHIAPLTFNSAFIPKFVELGEKWKSKRKGDTPFYMFGECCSRYGSVIYRDQHVLSSHYYTWKSDPALVAEWQGYTADWWGQQVVKEGAEPLGNMLTCEKDPGTVHDSKNVFLENGAWHEPDYSQASGFNVIDFPMHYNFNSADQAVRIAQEGDQYYNDASWNVVYVDSHDYSPGPSDGVRFSGGTAQWAENLSLMFTFRGIPCLYYGSEVEFQKGKTIDEGPGLALKESGRAYYGEYLEGDVEATDFGTYTASGNVQKTLNADLAQHIRRLNQIRAAVPALRRGQYTFDDCTAKGGHAFKRATKDSYALVALNGGATFTNVPAGTYTDIVTGKTYQGGGTITVDAPTNQGQLRVLVKGWTGGKVGDHGKFIYDTTPVSHGGAVSFEDPGTTEYYTYDDAVGTASVSFSPTGGTFKTETIDVTISLNEEAVKGWYKIGDAAQVNLTAGQQKTVTIGSDMNFGDTKSITWGATNSAGTEYTGNVKYRKVDPNASFSVYVACDGDFNMYAWGDDDSGKKVEPLGAWPGSKPSQSVDVDGTVYYYHTFDGMESVNVIFNHGGAQTANITALDADTFFRYDGGANAEKVDVTLTPNTKPGITLSPNGGEFDTETLTVSITAKNASSAWYRIGTGAQKNFSGTSSFTIGGDMSVGDSVTVSWSATGADGETVTGQALYTKIEKRQYDVVYFENNLNWNKVHAYAWTGNTEHFGAWPGVELTETTVLNGKTYYVCKLEGAQTGTQIIFNNGNNGAQTGDLSFVPYMMYNADGPTAVEEVDADEAEPEYFTLQGVRVVTPAPGIYVERRGSKVRKVVIR